MVQYIYNRISKTEIAQEPKKIVGIDITYYLHGETKKVKL